MIRRRTGNLSAMFALTASNDTLIGVACLVIIVCGVLFIFGRGWRH